MATNLDIFHMWFLIHVFSFLSKKVLSQNVENVGAENAVVDDFARLAICMLHYRNVLKCNNHRCTIAVNFTNV